MRVKAKYKEMPTYVITLHHG